MAIFSRRSLQRLLNEAGAFLKPEQLLRYVTRLNDPSADAIAYEWELAILCAFGKLGTLAHEPNLGGSTRPDIYLTPYGVRDPIVLDVAAVSDKGFEERNSYHAFTKEFRRRISVLRKQGIRGGFRITVGSSPSSLQRTTAPILRLPRPHRFRTVVFNDRFEEFLEAVTKGPSQNYVYSVETEETELTVEYDPRLSGVLTTSAQYRVAYSKQRNPIANALRQKAQQLKRTRFNGPFGIILCDADCDLLRSKTQAWPTYGAETIIQDFLRQHSSIAVIMTIRVAQFGDRVGPENLKIEYHLYPNHSGTFNPETSEVIRRMPTLLPRPIKDGCNARNHLEWLRQSGKLHEGESLWGGMTVSEPTIKISARAVLELLAGSVSQQIFFEEHGFSGMNPFRYKLEKGQLIRSASIEKSPVPEDDDEWLVFEFSGPDPAVSPLRAPGSEKV